MHVSRGNLGTREQIELRELEKAKNGLHMKCGQTVCNCESEKGEVDH